MVPFLPGFLDHLKRDGIYYCMSADHNDTALLPKSISKQRSQSWGYHLVRYLVISRTGSRTINEEFVIEVLR